MNIGFNNIKEKFYLSVNTNLILDKPGVKSTEKQEPNEGKTDVILISNYNLFILKCLNILCR